MRMQLGPFLTAVLILLGTASIYFLTKLWRARSFFAKLRKLDLVSEAPFQPVIKRPDKSSRCRNIALQLVTFKHLPPS